MNIASVDSGVTGTVFNIQRFCTGDGPGIRTTVFLKGCPLRCRWCHNPESSRAVPEISYSRDKCIGCGACAAVCPQGCHQISREGHLFDREHCRRCGVCAHACPTEALETIGRMMDVRQVLEEVWRDRLFYGAAGGMTLSGGEPLAQPRFSLALLKTAKANGLHTCVETSGYGKAEDLRHMVPFTDIFLYDYKETDGARHKEYTGFDNTVILENLRMLDRLGAQTVLRCPILPGYNDREDHFRGIAETASGLHNVLHIDVEPGHTLGNDKCERMGYARGGVNFALPDEWQIDDWIGEIARHTTVKVKAAGRA